MAHKRSLSHSKSGASMLEVTVVLVLLAVMLGAINSGTKRRLQTAMVEKTISEMSSLADAAVEYQRKLGVWPESINALVSERFMPAAVTSNAFGQQYVLGSNNEHFSVTTHVPGNLAINNSLGSILETRKVGALTEVRISKVKNTRFVGKILYENAQIK